MSAGYQVEAHGTGELLFHEVASIFARSPSPRETETKEQKIIKAKVGLLELAKQLGNVVSLALDKHRPADSGLAPIPAVSG